MQIALASGADIAVWNTETGEKTLTLTGHTNGVSTLTFSPAGDRLVSGSFYTSDGSLRIWDLLTGSELAAVKQPKRQARCVALSSDSNWLAAGYSDGMVSVWDLRRSTPRMEAERQARRLLKLKRDGVKSLEDLQAMIRSDKTISDMVRKQALDWAELFWKNRESDQD